MKAFIRKIYLLGIVFALAAGLTTFLGLQFLEAPLRREQARRTEAEIEYIVGEISATLSHVEKDLNTAAYYIRTEPDQQKIYHFLSEILEYNSPYLAIYLATPENLITYVGGWIPPPEFDVRSRPWYRAATREGKLIYTEPYLDAAEERWVITVANPIYDTDGELLGVVGIDGALVDMLAFLRGQSFIFSDAGELIVTSSDFDPAELEGLSSVFGDSKLDQTQGGSPVRFGAVEGSLHWKTLPESGFIVATFMPDSQISAGELRNQLVIDTVVFSFIVALLVLLIFLRVYIVLPMRELERDILAISLEDDVSYRLPVANKDSLRSLRESLNITLHKIQERFEQIVYQREELSAAYSQLIVHEQELQDQYNQIKQQREQIRQLAEVDALTGLYNRRKFQEDLSALLEIGESGAVFMLDIDDFKYINDTQGHSHGDRVLWSVARFMEQKLPSEAVAYRFGGDEFLIVVRREIDVSKIRLYIDEVSNLLDVLLPIQGKNNRITCSMGVVRYPDDGTTVDELLIKADIALHHAKRAGKNRHQFFEWSMAAVFSERMQLEEVLVEAIQNGAFELVYQPVVETATGQVAYFEALVRLQGHSISPAEFVPIAEELDLTRTMGYWVIQQALNHLTECHKTATRARAVSVNLSPKQFYDENLIPFLREQLTQKNVDGSFLELEITEAVLLDHPEEALKVIEQLKSLGVKLALDDYGSGYSSIDYLTRIKADRLKLHESLTGKYWDYKPVMEGLISIAHGLGMSVVAEGVERLEEARFLHKVNCDYLQGYLFSKPVSVQETLEIRNQDYSHLLCIEQKKEKES
ncbi:MAG: EAL domain-containing protein [Firmicutes bacterium]|nr:EAL domain-containing protein [Bacillota bacterium]